MWPTTSSLRYASKLTEVSPSWPTKDVGCTLVTLNAAKPCRFPSESVPLKSVGPLKIIDDLFLRGELRPRQQLFLLLA
eukprot:926391-Amphidinium_carterae.1